MSVVNIGVRVLSLLPASARRRNLIKKAVALTLLSEKAKIAGDINVVFASRSRMKQLNKQFLRRSHDTDVLAFNYDQPVPNAPFGDIFISAYQARLQAKQLGHSVLEEALTLAIHGALHLLGHDDDAPREKARMFRRQDLILAALRRRSANHY